MFPLGLYQVRKSMMVPLLSMGLGDQGATEAEVEAEDIQEVDSTVKQLEEEEDLPQLMKAEEDLVTLGGEEVHTEEGEDIMVVGLLS